MKQLKIAFCFLFCISSYADISLKPGSSIDLDGQIISCSGNQGELPAHWTCEAQCFFKYWNNYAKKDTFHPQKTVYGEGETSAKAIRNMANRCKDHYTIYGHGQGLGPVLGLDPQNPDPFSPESYLSFTIPTIQNSCTRDQ